MAWHDSPSIHPSVKKSKSKQASKHPSIPPPRLGGPWLGTWSGMHAESPPPCVLWLLTFRSWTRGRSQLGFSSLI